MKIKKVSVTKLTYMYIPKKLDSILKIKSYLNLLPKSLMSQFKKIMRQFIAYFFAFCPSILKYSNIRIIFAFPSCIKYLFIFCDILYFSRISKVCMTHKRSDDIFKTYYIYLYIFIILFNNLPLNPVNILFTFVLTRRVARI